ncbi:hypothetical protein N7456_004874 [Penicillium angulare]|uniref:Nucleolar protein Dnt1-like N-terminal domain-containing protein n=1 Tax=Penicillium angulare TaxID=116970 RepID=A0A9W9FXF8_9EURO|nr:hypothetical protein N7456_004874 [Penicillium angulare]
MVFLRLEVRVYPRESGQNGSIFSTVLGKRPENEDPNGPKKTYAGFLLTLKNPEEYTMGDLSYLIKEKWQALRPEAEQLAIKKLLDDTMPSIDLEVGMCVADVFVDRGKALADGHDQRGIVRVVQKPNDSHAPVRFPSVVQDFEGASEAYARKKAKKSLGKAFSPIPEHPHDTPISSVEIPHQPLNDAPIPSPLFITNGESLNVTSPSPRERSRKRKQSTPDRHTPAKEARVEKEPRSNDNSPSILRRSKRIPSFASPNRRLSYSQPAQDGLGLGITGSPKANRTAPSNSSPQLPPVHQSILSKSSKNTHSNPKRRISFAESATPPADSHPNKKPASTSTSASRQKHNTSIPPSSQSVVPTSSQVSNIQYPPGVDPEKIRRLAEEGMQHERCKSEARRLLNDPNADKSLLALAKSICQMVDRPKKSKSFQDNQKLKALLNEFKDKQDKLAQMAQPEDNGKDKEVQDSEDESESSEEESDSSEEESSDSEEESSSSDASSESDDEENENESSKTNNLFDMEAVESSSAKHHAGTKQKDSPVQIFDSSDSDDQEMGDLDLAPANAQDKQVSESEHDDDTSSENNEESSHVSGNPDPEDQEMVDAISPPVNSQTKEPISEPRQDDGAVSESEHESSRVSGNLDSEDQQTTDPTPASVNDQTENSISESTQDDGAVSESEHKSSRVSGNLDSEDQQMAGPTFTSVNDQTEKAISESEQDGDDGSEDDDDSSSQSGASDSEDEESIDSPPAPVNGQTEKPISQSEQEENAGYNDQDESERASDILGPHDHASSVNRAILNNVENSTPRSGGDSNSVEGDQETEPEKKPVTRANQSEDEDQSSDEESESESDSDSDSDPNLTFPPLHGKSPAKSAKSTPIKQEPPTQTRPKTLKELLQIHKAEQAARQTEGQKSMAKPATTTSAPKRRNIFESYDGSSEDSDSSDGDVLPNGSAGRLFKQRPLNH